MTPQPRFLGLLHQKLCWIPTPRACLLALLLLLLVTVTVVKTAYPFLAQTAPYPDGPVLVDGWAGDPCLRAAIEEFHRHDYPVLIFTGGPVERDSLFHAYGTFAQLGAANAERLGFPREKAQPIPAPEVEKDRTYASAVAAREWLLAQGPVPAHVTVVTQGPHARRSRELFQRGFGSKVKVGVIAIRDTGFNPDRWWTSSAGFRAVTSEIIAYTYAKLLFWRTEE
jgi:hypothetical protein